jgi:hypothetical protein
MLDAYATTFVAAALAATLSAGTIAIPAVVTRNAAYHSSHLAVPNIAPDGSLQFEERYGSEPKSGAARNQ